MYYFEESENCIKKYSVSYDIDELTKINNEIKNKCSIIEHHSYKGASGPRVYDDFEKEIKNLHYEKTGDVIEYNDAADETVYHYQYDLYMFPELSIQLNKLIKLNSEEALTNILVMSFDVEDKIDYLKDIKRVKEELNELTECEIQEMKDKIKEIEVLINKAEAEDNRYAKDIYRQKLLKEYHQKIMKLIKLELVDTIDIDYVNKYESFFDTNKVLTKKN